MMPLPPVFPDTAHRFSTKLGRDHYVRVSTCDYSVHPKAIGRRIDVRVDPEWITASCAGEIVARHKRSLAPHRTITAVEHARARRKLKQRRSDVQREVEIDVEVRDLAVYDDYFGVA
jgi:hypothetical protein